MNFPGASCTCTCTWSTLQIIFRQGCFRGILSQGHNAFLGQIVCGSDCLDTGCLGQIVPLPKEIVLNRQICGQDYWWFANKNLPYHSKVWATQSDEKCWGQTTLYNNAEFCLRKSLNEKCEILFCFPADSLGTISRFMRPQKIRTILTILPRTDSEQIRDNFLHKYFYCQIFLTAQTACKYQKLYPLSSRVNV